jgi:putative transposase
MAIGSHRPAAGTLIHSDQAVPFTSWGFSQRAKPSGLLPSMGTIGDAYDTQSRMMAVRFGSPV